MSVRKKCMKRKRKGLRRNEKEKWEDFLFKL